VINQEVEDQIIDLMAGDFLKVASVPVQQQHNFSDCGVFAIAFATCLVFGVDPQFVTFYIKKMRPHLASCLRKDKMEMFPTST